MSLRSTLTVGVSAVALAGAVVAAPAASAAPPVLMGCETQSTGLETCLSFFYPGGTGFGAKATITDPAGAAEYDVRVNHVEFQRWRNGGWEVVSSSADIDGWHADQDVAKTRAGSACGFAGVRLRARATYAWRDAGGAVQVQDFVTDGNAEGIEC